jgi:hypothetical protein
MAANLAVAKDPAANLNLTKDKSIERIDGIIPTIMAIGRVLLARTYRLLDVSRPRE